jgi:hypothetical protein
MSANNYIAKIKARLDQAIIQRDHWKQLAAKRNYLLVSVIDPDSRTTCEYRVDPDNVRAMWVGLDELRTANQRLEQEISKLKTVMANQSARQFVGHDDQRHIDDLVAAGIRASDAERLRLEGDVARLREALELWLTGYDEVAASPNFEPFPHVAERVAKTRAALRGNGVS